METQTKNLNDEAIEFAKNMPEEVIEVINRSIVENQKKNVKGLGIGDKAPDFVLTGIADEKIKLYDLLKKGPVVLSFFRGSWCPFCNIELKALQKHYAEIKDLGAELITVHPQNMELAREFYSPFNFDFSLLSDEKQEVIASYQIKFQVTESINKLYMESLGIDLNKLNANGLWNLPVPATFIIDTDGTIKGRYFSHDFLLRMEPEDIKTMVKNLPNTSPEPVYERDLVV